MVRFSLLAWALWGLAPLQAAAEPGARARALGYAAIALAKPVAARVDAEAAENRLWGDPAPCARLLGGALEQAEQTLAADAGGLPPGLEDLARRISASPLVADERIARYVPSACSRQGLEEYGTWCNDLLNGLGLTDAHKRDLRLLAAREILGTRAQAAAGQCPTLARRSVELLGEALAR